MTKKEKIEQYLIDRINFDGSEYEKEDWYDPTKGIMMVREVVSREQHDKWNYFEPLQATLAWLKSDQTIFEASTKPFRQRQILKEWMSSRPDFFDRMDDEWVKDVYISRVAMEFADYWKRFDKGRVVKPLERKREKK